MVKQRLEGHFREVINADKSLYYLKLQVNPLAHTTSPADFLVINKHNQVFMIECKECNSKSFAFNRLTQLNKLKHFNDFSMTNYGYVLISFWLGSKKKSLYYMIHINEIIKFIKSINKKSANVKDFEECLYMNRIKLNEINTVFGGII